ncbi:right-handed parallel beta-helix repeat-containing protein [Bacteroides sp. 224]|uniref:right-handed parallel beta-helix repeat-containing protein n=1 Tax=Bacteroides sp. 224 TaxID=2302936 RepID=UPI0013D07A98|nr:right-handed parallel beta-helix repeat-containing protein [Bacteroides sp. 224]NDV64727.1 right-handed parallel beta-helix repeat-containing protein [Bacteroides sp. 224]
MKRIRLLFILSLIAFRAVGGEIWVSPNGNDANPGTKESPLRTVAEALKQAREWRRLSNPAVKGGIHIILEQGTYKQDKVLFIRPEDSGTADSPTWIESAPESKAIISGGVPLKSWKKVAEEIPGLPEAAQGNIWVAESPRIGNKLLDFRQLWIDGNKATRSIQFEPGKMERMLDFIPGKEEIWIPTPNITGLNTADQLEMVVHQRWAIAILRVKEFDIQGTKTRVTFHQPESQLEFAHPWPQPIINGEKGSSSFFLCNAIQLLDKPGEWYREYPSGKIYYWPREGEDMHTVSAVVPALEEIVKVDGSLERPVSHIHFKNIHFENSTCIRPSYQGHVTLQGGLYLLDAYKLKIPGLPEKATLENQAWIARPEAAVRVRGGNNINFTKCTFQHLASTGLDYEWAVNHSSVEDCLFTDIGGSAILLGSFPDGGFETHVPYIPENSREMCSHIRISNNLITEVTNEDWGCVGIGAGYVSDVNIEHNEVGHVNYSGICVGWGWTKLDSGMKNNRIHANYVHHFAKQLYDAGGLYTLSSQPGSSMTNNRIEHLIDAPYATNDRAFYIYFDEATSYYRVENNWCPEERFDSNSPGPGNVWRNNGPY